MKAMKGATGKAKARPSPKRSLAVVAVPEHGRGRPKSQRTCFLIFGTSAQLRYTKHSFPDWMYVSTLCCCAPCCLLSRVALFIVACHAVDFRAPRRICLRAVPYMSARRVVHFRASHRLCLCAASNMFARRAIYCRSSRRLFSRVASYMFACRAVYVRAVCHVLFAAVRPIFVSWVVWQMFAFHVFKAYEI